MTLNNVTYITVEGFISRLLHVTLRGRLITVSVKQIAAGVFMLSISGAGLFPYVYKLKYRMALWAALVYDY